MKPCDCYQQGSAGALAVVRMTFKEVGDYNEGEPHSYPHFTLVHAGSIGLESNLRTKDYGAGELIWIPVGVRHRMVGREPFTVVFCFQALYDLNNPTQLFNAEIPPGTPDWLRPMLVPPGAVPLTLEAARKAVPGFDEKVGIKV